jgi:hypothetical protein
MSDTGRVFGLTPAQRMERQIARRASVAPFSGRFAYRASVVTTESTLDWLVAHPGIALTNAHGEALIAFLPNGSADARAQPHETLESLRAAGRVMLLDAAGEVFSRQLRRRQPLIALDLSSMSSEAVERTLFDHVYKGVTDAVTRYVWPKPAFWLTRLLAYARVAPNTVTLVGMSLTVVAAWCFAEQRWTAGLVAAWLMTFLDTVDGKLARVTATSSDLGDRLDHVTDWIHPPAWWVCFAVGIAGSFGAPSETLLRASCIVILLCYVLGRVSETAFKRRFGFNQFLWQPFDSHLRSVIARRNPLLLILSVGVALGDPRTAYHVAAIWSVLSIGLQIGRWLQAEALRRRGVEITNWMA